MDPRVHPWTDAEIKILMENYQTHYKKEIQQMIKDQLGIDRTYGSIKHYMHKHNLYSEIDTKYQKGHPSATKGKKVSPETYEKLKKTMWKKGRVPDNTLPIGSIVKSKPTTNNKKPYWFIKTGPQEWQLYHRYLWEKANGPVPKGSRLRFLDGDTDNCQLSNLRLVTDREHMLINYMAPKEFTAEEGNLFCDIAKLEVFVKEHQ